MEKTPTLPYVMGVRRSCVLNSLPYFNTCENFSVDIMQDILEGVAQYEMKLLTTLDQKLHNVKGNRQENGYMEQNNKPPALK